MLWFEFASLLIAATDVSWNVIAFLESLVMRAFLINRSTHYWSSCGRLESLWCTYRATHAPNPFTNISIVSPPLRLHPCMFDNISTLRCTRSVVVSRPMASIFASIRANHDESVSVPFKFELTFFFSRAQFSFRLIFACEIYNHSHRIEPGFRLVVSLRETPDDVGPCPE